MAIEPALPEQQRHRHAKVTSLDVGLFLIRVLPESFSCFTAVRSC